ncbi:hypothetical protein KAU88_06450 [Candidatus Bathyarchaeota archaeon]|nr:hypothetical protein [Candidatus Bathyarchaeota archaeon]
MNEASRIDLLKSECLRLFEFKNDNRRYEDETLKLEARVIHHKLDHTIDPTHLRYFLLQQMFKEKLSSLNRDEFNKSVENFFSVKKTNFYFQLSELEKFPNNYRLGYGVLLTFKSMPQLVKVFAKSLAKGKIVNEKPEKERILREIVKKIVIPQDPHIGYWLKITTSAISYSIRFENAFEFSEESLDILRIATPTARIHLPQHAIGMNTNENKPFLATTVEFNRYPYYSRKQKLIDRLNNVCVKPSSELEERIKDALHFQRIGDNHSPDHQRLFFYVAAIERLIISSKTDLTHKFSEKGAILLGNDLKDRLDLSESLEKLYRKRSSIAHGGRSKYDFFMTIDARRYLNEIIIRILNLIDAQGLRNVSPKNKKKKMGDSLDEIVDRIIYSG